MSEEGHPIKIFFVCTGVDLSRRGIESFFREAFEGLKDAPGLDITLYKGGGRDGDREKRIRCVPKESRLGRLLGKAIRRSGYVVEQLTFLPGLIKEIRKHRPAIIFYSDASVGMNLYKYRNWIGDSYKLLFSNGAPLASPILMTDHVHQVTPFYYEQALAVGESVNRNTLVPYGIIVPQGPPLIDPQLRADVRRKLGLPADRKIILSVGAIGMKTHKRMPHLIREVGRMATPRPFLLLLGPVEEGRIEFTKLADEVLGHDNYQLTSVPYGHVGEYYKAADVFTLASLSEGFGRVYIEAMIAGLPCVVHDHPIMRYVLGGLGIHVDMAAPGACSLALATELSKPFDPAAAIERRESVRTRFAWKSLQSDYTAMFRKCVAGASN
ncbi:MAG: glycosyltransferase family 4 protein [Burkholderiales bacterium]|nr:glycosyltransferase family 4 protein [Phycisphaerae bacterium]